MKHLSHLLLSVIILLTTHFASADPVRAYVVTFAYQNALNRPNRSHTAATFFLADGDRVVDQVDISWLPHPDYFIGASGADVPPVRRVPGTNYPLAQTFRFAEILGEPLLRFGPYETSTQLFEMAKQQRARLNSGAIDYKMVDTFSRPGAVNCIHAVTDTVGFTATGLLHGANASAFVINHFTRNGHVRSVVADDRLYSMLKNQLLLNKNEGDGF